MDELNAAISIILNSQKTNQLTQFLGTMQPNDRVLIWNSAEGELQQAQREKLVPALTVSVSNLGAVTSAGATTTNQEIEDYFNAEGFIIPDNSLKILECSVQVSGVSQVQRYFYLPNISGAYGTAVSNPISFFDLYLFSGAQAAQVADAEERIGNLWHYPANNGQVTNGQEFRGFITANRYVVGKVLDAVGFDIDDPTKAELYIDNQY